MYALHSILLQLMVEYAAIQVIRSYMRHKTSAIKRTMICKSPLARSLERESSISNYEAADGQPIFPELSVALLSLFF